MSNSNNTSTIPVVGLMMSEAIDYYLAHGWYSAATITYNHYCRSNGLETGPLPFAIWIESYGKRQEEGIAQGTIPNFECVNLASPPSSDPAGSDLAEPARPSPYDGTRMSLERILDGLDYLEAGALERPYWLLPENVREAVCAALSHQMQNANSGALTGLAYLEIHARANNWKLEKEYFRNALRTTCRQLPPSPEFDVLREAMDVDNVQRAGWNDYHITRCFLLEFLDEDVEELNKAVRGEYGGARQGTAVWATRSLIMHNAAWGAQAHRFTMLMESLEEIAEKMVREGPENADSPEVVRARVWKMLGIWQGAAWQGSALGKAGRGI